MDGILLKPVFDWLLVNYWLYCSITFGCLVFLMMLHPKDSIYFVCGTVYDDFYVNYWFSLLKLLDYLYNKHGSGEYLTLLRFLISKTVACTSITCWLSILQLIF